MVRVLGAGLLVVVPTLSYGWGGLWTWAPDLAIVIATLALLLAAAATMRVVGLLRSRRSNRPVTTTARDLDHVRVRSSSSR